MGFVLFLMAALWVLGHVMKAPVRARLIGQLEQDEVPARMLERLDAGPQGG